MAKKGPKRIPLIEWVTACFGLAVVVGMIGFLVVESVRSRDGVPPVMTVQPLRLAKTGGQYILEVQVENSTTKTAASVQIEGKLTNGSGDVETSNASLSYVPGGSHRSAALVFTRDPRKHQLQLRVTGFERP